jgi:hypothetical protein
MGEARRRSAGGKGEERLFQAFRYTCETLALALIAGQVEHTRETLAAINSLLGRMRDRRRESMLCLSCDHNFGPDEAPAEVQVVIPFKPTGADNLVVSPVCAACAAESEEAKTVKSLEALRALWKGARLIASGTA